MIRLLCLIGFGFTQAAFGSSIREIETIQVTTPPARVLNFVGLYQLVPDLNPLCGLRTYDHISHSHVVNYFDFEGYETQRYAQDPGGDEVWDVASMIQDTFDCKYKLINLGVELKEANNQLPYAWFEAEIIPAAHLFCFEEQQYEGGLECISDPE